MPHRSFFLRALLCVVPAVLAGVWWAVWTRGPVQIPRADPALVPSAPGAAEREPAMPSALEAPPPLEELSAAHESSGPGPAAATASLLSGVVRDERARPWTRFRLLLRPVRSEERPAEDRRLALSIELASADGSYAQAGLAPGRWIVSAQSGSSSTSREVDIGADDVALDLVLPRPAALSGTVVDPAGLPSSGARICVVFRGEARFAAAARGPEAVTADERGGFELRDLPAGELALEATSPGSAASARLSVELAAGEERSDVRLVLRRPARILGRALDDLGRPDAGRELAFMGPPACGSAAEQTTGADAEGRFELSNLSPGEYWIRRVLRPEEAREAGSSPERDRSLARLRSGLRLELGEGETREIVLGGGADPGVRLWGFVTGVAALDEPLFVNAERDGAPATAPRRFARVDEQGGYEMLLDAGGEHTIRVDASGGTLLAVRTSIAEAGSQRLDLELGTASISGRVTGADGAPVVGAEVSLALTPTEEMVRLGQRHSRRCETDEHGAFAFGRVEPGSYSLTARPAGSGSRAPGSAASARLEHLAVAPGAELTDIELVLGPAGAIEVVVVGPDGPLSGARVRAADPRGHASDARPARPTDESGATRIEGLAPGTWFVHATHQHLTGAWSEPIQVPPSGTASARLELAPGAMLEVNVTGVGEPGAWLSVRDARGFELARSWVRPRDPKAARLPHRPTTVGPLPFGSLTLRAEDEQGRAQSVALAIDSLEPEPVAIHLGD